MPKLKEIFFFLNHRLELKFAIRSGVTACLAWSFGVYYATALHRIDPVLSGMWAVFSALVVLQEHLGSTYMTSWNRFLGVMIGSFAGALAANFLRADTVFSLGMAVAFTVMLAGTLRLKDTYRIASLSAAIVILWSMRQEIYVWQFAFNRFLDSSLGIAIAFVVAHFLWPSETLAAIKQNNLKVLSSFRELIPMIFHPNGESEEKEHIVQSLIDSIEELLAKNHIFLDELKLEPSSAETWKTWNQIWEAARRLLDICETCSELNIDQISLLMDPPLFESASKTVEKLTQILFHIQESMEESLNVDIHSQDLKKNLQQALVEFRERRSTRKFHLKDVEDFYVYFHQVEKMIETLEDFNTT